MVHGEWGDHPEDHTKKRGALKHYVHPCKQTVGRGKEKEEEKESTSLNWVQCGLSQRENVCCEKKISA